jgi:hypothetical protein
MLKLNRPSRVNILSVQSHHFLINLKNNKQKETNMTVPHEPTEPSKAIDHVRQSFSAEKWSQPESGLDRRFEGVHLGRIGNTHSFKDESRTPVPEAGITFNVVQNSAGMTGIYTEALPDYSVEALQFDEKTNQLKWAVPHPSGSDVLVSGDWGELVTDKPVDWSKGGNFGIEGSHAGIVRVTDTNGEAKYFFLGADFKGESDDWTVTGGIVEVKPTNLAMLPPSEPKAEQPSIEEAVSSQEPTIDEETSSDSKNPYYRLFRPELTLGQVTTPSDSAPDTQEVERDAALRSRTPQPPLTEADIARLTQSRGHRPTNEEIAGMNAARARGIHN